MPAAGGADQLGGRSDELPDEGAQPVLAGGLGQQVELHGLQQRLRQLFAGVKGLVGQQLVANGMVQVQVPQRPLEGVLLALLAAVAAHQFGKQQVVPGAEDDRVDGE